VIHGDFHPANVLLKDDGTAAVIDWGGAAVSDYRTDLAWTLLLTKTYGDSATRGRILSLYEQLSGHRVEHIEYFEVAAMLRRLFTVSVWASGQAGSFAMRPGIEAKIREDINHVRQAYALLVRATGIRIPETETLLS